MYQREIFRINPCPMPPTYVYTNPCETSVSYKIPYYTVLKRNDQCCSLLSETQSIRHELNQIKNDIGEIKRQQSAPTYYMVKQDYSNDTCSLCTASSSKNQPTHYVHAPVYCCDEYPRFVEERTRSAVPKYRSKNPTTTYQDSYQSPIIYGADYGNSGLRITVNELQTESPPSLAPAKHPRHWIPTCSKNTYPHRRWNLNTPHPEP